MNPVFICLGAFLLLAAFSTLTYLVANARSTQITRLEEANGREAI